MLTLKQKIDQAKQELQGFCNSAKVYEDHIRELEDSRADCDHEWDDGIKGWEHEGRYCKKCGINDQYAPGHKKAIELKRQVKAK